MARGSGRSSRAIGRPLARALALAGERSTPAYLKRVREYLQKAYLHVSEGKALDLVQAHLAIVADGCFWDSDPDYVGDKIARLEGLEENPAFDPDAGKDEEES